MLDGSTSFEFSGTLTLLECLPLTTPSWLDLILTLPASSGQTFGCIHTLQLMCPGFLKSQFDILFHWWEWPMRGFLWRLGLGNIVLLKFWLVWGIMVQVRIISCPLCRSGRIYCNRSHVLSNSIPRCGCVGCRLHCFWACYWLLPLPAQGWWCFLVCSKLYVSKKLVFAQWLMLALAWFSIDYYTGLS